MKDCHITVSVIMITYGHEQFIKKAIHGVLCQKCDFEIELIIADDHSPDRTEFEVEQAIKSYPNKKWVKYTRHSKNKGMMNNFIWAMQQAKGKYIALCEGDDYWIDPLKLQKQIDFMTGNKNYSTCFSNRLSINENGEVHKEHDISGDYQLEDIVGGVIPYTQTILFQKSMLDLTQMEKYTHMPSGDRLLTFLLSLSGPIYALKDYTSCYRIHKNGIWSSYGSNLDSERISIQRYIEFKETVVNKELTKPHDTRYYLKLSERLIRIIKDYKITSAYTVYKTTIKAHVDLNFPTYFIFFCFKKLFKIK